jgi:16S rRNA (uracil1498-N3)-methyltransferase
VIVATAGGARGPGPERAYCRPLPSTGRVELDRDESHHLVRVRRARDGDAVVLFDGEGGTRLGRLAAADPRGATVEIVGPYPDREPARHVVVAAALPAGARADDLVATLAELGAAALVPLVCERSGGAPEDLARRRAERFLRLAREAAKVNGRSRLLRVEGAMSPAGVAAEARFPGCRVLLDPDPTLPGLADVLGARPGPCVLLVGPEGGFTDAEVDACREAGAAAASLGACALRTETAAAAAAAIALALGGGAAP